MHTCQIKTVFLSIAVLLKRTQGLSNSEAILGFDFYLGSGPDENGTHMPDRNTWFVLNLFNRPYCLFIHSLIIGNLSNMSLTQHNII